LLKLPAHAFLRANGPLAHAGVAQTPHLLNQQSFHLVRRLEFRPFVARKAKNTLETSQQIRLLPQLLNQLLFLVGERMRIGFFLQHLYLIKQVAKFVHFIRTNSSLHHPPLITPPHSEFSQIRSRAVQHRLFCFSFFLPNVKMAVVLHNYARLHHRKADSF
jgi:hypothetical protein